MGWPLEDDQLKPVLVRNDPIPQACLEMISCKYRTGCKSLKCKCMNGRLSCTDLCRCDKSIISS